METGEFLFAIGQVVLHKSTAHEPNPPRWVVLEQAAVRCHGGVQRYYHCRATGIQGNPLERFAEPELAPVPPDQKARTAADKVNDAKEWLVHEGDFEGAAQLRDLLDKWLKGLKTG